MTTTAATRTPGKPTRFACYGYALLALLLAPLVALALVAVVLALVLVVLWVGVYLVPPAFRLAAWTAERYRCTAAAVLRREVRTTYRDTGALTGWTRAQTVLTDEARWRDVAWMVLFGGLTWVLPYLVVTLPWTTISLWPVYAYHHGGTLLANVEGASQMLASWVAWFFLVRPLTRFMARIDAAVLSDPRAEVERRLAASQAARAEQLDVSAAELRRIERDLHDGPQARLASLAMTLGLAEQLLDRDPVQARALVAEARGTASGALVDLRGVVRGIHPPVLADRGLAGALQALAVDLPLPVHVRDGLRERLPAPVESALYFAASECLANAVKHADAHEAGVELAHEGDAVHVIVTDDGRGGASVGAAGGLAGVARRLSAFDGTLGVVSPAGGPTTITLEVPCASWWGRTTPSSGTV